MSEIEVALLIIKLKPEPAPSRSFWHDVLRYLLRDKLTLFALSILLALTLACLLGPPIVEKVFKVDPNRTHVTDRYLTPGPDHPLGTDNLGRDQLIRVLYGGRNPLATALFARPMSVWGGLANARVPGD